MELLESQHNFYYLMSEIKCKTIIVEIERSFLNYYRHEEVERMCE